MANQRSQGGGGQRPRRPDYESDFESARRQSPGGRFASEDEIDYRWEGARPPQNDQEWDETDDGYDRAARSGSGRFAEFSGEGGVFGTTGGGSYAGGFQIVGTPGMYRERENRARSTEGQRSRYGRSPDRFDQIQFELPDDEERGGGRVGHQRDEVNRPENFRGIGPAGWTRRDGRIREEVCELMTADDRLDASGIEIEVEDGEVTLTGSVDGRSTKRYAERLAESIDGVRDVHNRLTLSR
jgi:hypothetical protein